MPIISYRCENCGASMELDSTNTKLQCPFCGAEYAFRPEQRPVDRDSEVARQILKDNLAEFYYDDGTCEKRVDSTHVLNPGMAGNLALTKVVVPPSVQEIGAGVSEDAGTSKKSFSEARG